MAPHPVIVTLRDNKDNIKVLFYSYYTTITGWGFLLTYLWGAGIEGMEQKMVTTLLSGVVKGQLQGFVAVSNKSLHFWFQG